MRNQIVDRAAGTGVFAGDLRYGRRNGHVAEKNGDYSGPANDPIVPLVLVTPRDPEVWTKDSRVKERKQKVGVSQHLINHAIEEFLVNGSRLRSNITLTVGKQRLK